VKGHFKQRGSTWYYWADLGVGPDGRRLQKSQGGFRTRRDAERAFGTLRDSVRTGSYAAETKLTVAEFLLEEWLPAIRATVRPTTLQHYTSFITVHVVPRIGKLKLTRLGPAQLNSMYASLLERGRADGRGGLSPKSVRHVHTCLHKALHDAVRWGHLARNPADVADPPVPRTPEMTVWSPTELRAFLASVADDRLYAAWLLLITTGMRRGEALGLRWEDVDLERARLSIVRQLTTVNYTVTVSEPKTAKGRRAIALDATTVKALRTHRARQNEERLKNAVVWQDSGLVFTQEDGSPLHPQRFSAWFVQRRLAAGLPPIRLHDVRHSYATAALSAGVAAKVVSERLGHANTTITLDTYSHVLPALQEDAADKVAALILGP
jgi:integrase